jgi:hypothetical protein
VALATLAACTAAPAALAPAELTRIHDAAHRSTWSALAGRGQALFLEGTATFLGREETFDFLLVGDGRYRRSVSGPLGRVEVFDGQRVVRRDASGITRELALGDHAEAPLLASILTGAWAATAGLRPRVLRVNAPHTLVVDRPGTPLEFELQLDPTTLLPDRIVEETASGESTMQLGDWSMVGGVAFPASIRVTSSADEDQAAGELYSVRRATIVDLDPRRFELDLALPSDFVFDPSESAELEVQRAPTGHLLVHPLVEGVDVGWFILDSGAGANVIDTTASAALELEHLGEVRAVGVSGSAPSHFVQGTSLELGPMRLEAPVFVELELGFLTGVFGVPVGGIVGYDLFSRAVVAIDHSSASLFDPTRFEPDPSWSVVELAFQGSTPCARASFPTRAGDVEAWFRLDTGDNGALTFHAPAVERYDLLAGRDTTLANFGGVGGGSTGYFGELEWFELAGRRMSPIQAGFATSNIGTFGDEYTAGNIGQAIFRGARLVFDFPHQRLYFAPTLEADALESQSPVRSSHQLPAQRLQTVGFTEPSSRSGTLGQRRLSTTSKVASDSPPTQSAQGNELKALDENLARGSG